MMNLTGDGNGFDMVMMPEACASRCRPRISSSAAGYERNPVAIRNNTVAKLIAATDAVMDQARSSCRAPGTWRLRIPNSRRAIRHGLCNSETSWTPALLLVVITTGARVRARRGAGGRNRLGRKIVLLSDGTGNSAAKVWRTNVWRVFEALDLSGNRPDRRSTTMASALRLSSRWQYSAALSASASSATSSTSTNSPAATTAMPTTKSTASASAAAPSRCASSSA